MFRFVLIVLLSLFSFAFSQSDVRVDGSSTVYPISLAIAEEFSIENPYANVSVAFSGTGGGFSKFCSGETQVNNASRVIKQSEIDKCEENGVEFIEIPVAFDALTIATNLENDWAQCITVGELRSMWSQDSGVTLWSDVRPEWPSEPIEFYAPGVDSGTFDYFTEAILDEGEIPIRTDFFPSEDDNVLVQGVEGNPYALSFFGYAYYLEEDDKLNAVSINNGEGCIEPSTDTIESGAYTPLARPLFIYVNAAEAESNEFVQGFVDFYLDDYARDLIADTGYSILDDEVYELALQRFNERATGSLFIDSHGKTVLEVLSQ